MFIPCLRILQKLEGLSKLHTFVYFNSENMQKPLCFSFDLIVFCLSERNFWRRQDGSSIKPVKLNISHCKHSIKLQLVPSLLIYTNNNSLIHLQECFVNIQNVNTNDHKAVYTLFYFLKSHR